MDKYVAGINTNIRHMAPISGLRLTVKNINNRPGDTINNIANNNKIVAIV